MPNAPMPKKKDVPDGVWMKCKACERTVFRKLVEEMLWVCPECNYHFPLSAALRIQYLVDEGSFEEMYADLEPVDSLRFHDLKSYKERLATHQEKTKLKDAVVAGMASIEDHRIVLSVMDSNFIMASMGAVVGEKITRSVETATEFSIPLVILCASGGARMQEGVFSLMQMAKTTGAISRLKEAGVLYISVLTDPTTAGVLASFASLGDFVLAEPKALIGFTGPRVIKETIKAELPDGFQTSEFLLKRGFVDRVVPRAKLRREIARIIDFCT